jgi:uncharacterized protein YukE
VTDVLRVDSVALRSAEPDFDALAAAVDGVLSRLTAALSAQGRCWGGDEMGGHFEPPYLDGVHATCNGIAAVRGAVARVGQSVLSAADSVDAADARARSRFA